MSYIFHALSTKGVENWRSGGVDANRQSPARATSDGGGNPCRYCLNDIPEGAEMLILACRPFSHLNCYSEVGPIFLCAECERYDDGTQIPPVLASRERHLFKGYSADGRIVYGTGEIVETVDISAYLEKSFAQDEVRYVHVRSATNNCFTLRIDQS